MGSGGGSVTAPSAPVALSSPGVDYSSLLPSSTDMSSYAPLSYQDFGSVPTVAASTVSPASVANVDPMQAATQANVAGPTAAQTATSSLPTAQAASVDNSTLPGALQSYENMNAQALAPTFQTQNDALTSDLAARGIFNSTAGQELQNNLSGQQASALASADSPLVQQMQAAYNSNNQLNATNQQTANNTNYSGQLESTLGNTANQQATNLAGYQGLLSQAANNAANQQATNAANYAGNQSNAQLNANNQQQAGLANQSSYNNANQYNADAYGAVTAGNETNQNNYLSALMSMDASTRTALLNNVLATYDPSANGTNSLSSIGLQNAGSAYTNAFNNGAAGTANLSSTLGSLGGSLASGSNSNAGFQNDAGQADSSNASFGDY